MHSQKGACPRTPWTERLFSWGRMELTLHCGDSGANGSLGAWGWAEAPASSNQERTGCWMSHTP